MIGVYPTNNKDTLRTVAQHRRKTVHLIQTNWDGHLSQFCCPAMLFAGPADQTIFYRKMSVPAQELAAMRQYSLPTQPSTIEVQRKHPITSLIHWDVDYQYQELVLTVSGKLTVVHRQTDTPTTNSISMPLLSWWQFINEWFTVPDELTRLVDPLRHQKRQRQASQWYRQQQPTTTDLSQALLRRR